MNRESTAVSAGYMESRLETSAQVSGKTPTSSLCPVIYGFDSVSNMALVKYIRSHPGEGIKCLIGLHPFYARLYTDDFLCGYMDIIESNMDIIAGIGMIGLDYTGKSTGFLNPQYERTRKDTRVTQMNTLREMILLSEKYALPMVLYERGASDDLLYVLGDNKKNISRIVVCTRDRKYMKRYMDLGCRIGIHVTANIIAELESMLETIPLDRLVANPIPPPWITENQVKGDTDFLFPYMRQQVSVWGNKKTENPVKTILMNTYDFFHI